MKCVGEVCHVSSTRIRVQIPHAKGNKTLLSSMGSHFAALPKVTKVAANPRTGSLVLNHQRSGDEVLAAMESGKEYPLALHFSPKPEALSKTAKHKVKKTLRSANQKMTFLSDGALDMPTVLGLGLMGMAFYQLRRGLFLPAGLTMMLLAYKVLDLDHNNAP